MAEPVLRVGVALDALAPVPAPDAYTYGLQDVSSSDAGRVEDEGATMYKMRVAQKRKISVSWKNRDAATVAGLMQAFNPEYVYVEYPDAMSGEQEVRQFYTGDKSAALSQIKVGGATYSTLGFDLIER